jgi:hypothetical protein
MHTQILQTARWNQFLQVAIGGGIHLYVRERALV